jgi:hypothetical protein
MAKIEEEKKQVDLISMLSGVQDLDPMYFIESYRTIDGNPFRIRGTGREYLIDFYRYLCVGILRDKKPVVVVKGRQVEMTEAALNVAMYFLNNYKYFNVLHAFPTKEQCGVFSKERVQGAIRDSVNKKFVNQLADHKNAVNTVSAIEFKNSDYYYIRSAWAEADSIRGLSVDALLRDEFQDWSESAIGNADMTIARSPYQIKFSFGTPKAAGTKFEKLWELSDQRYFHPKCISCGEYFMITLDNFLEKTLIQCPKCKTVQSKQQANAKGKWIPTRQAIKEGSVGFHISQLIHPEISREQIARQQAESGGGPTFKNEVLGEFFTGGSLPLSPAEVIERCCEPNKDIWFPGIILPPKETFMGIDWGSRSDVNDKGAFTVLTIISKERDQYKLEYAKKVTHSEYGKQVQYIKDMIKLYNCVNVVADIGAGQMQCQMLQQEYGDRVKSCYYAYNLRLKIDYNEKIWMYTVDRDAFLEEIIDIINKGQISMPWQHPEELEWLIEHVCNTQINATTYSGNVRRKYEKVNRSKPNDGLHSLNYAYIASYTHLGEGGVGRSAQSSLAQTSTPLSISTNFNGRPSPFSKIFSSLNSASNRRGRNR